MAKRYFIVVHEDYLENIDSLQKPSYDAAVARAKEISSENGELYIVAEVHAEVGPPASKDIVVKTLVK